MSSQLSLPRLEGLCANLVSEAFRPTVRDCRMVGVVCRAHGKREPSRSTAWNRVSRPMVVGAVPAAFGHAWSTGGAPGFNECERLGEVESGRMARAVVTSGQLREAVDALGKVRES